MAGRTGDNLMTRARAWLSALLSCLGIAVCCPGVAHSATRTFAESFDKVWNTTRSVVESDGWDLDEEDRRRGTMLTESRSIDYLNFGVYGKGTRHRLKITVRSGGARQTSVTIDREVFKQERILWSTDRTPLKAANDRIEAVILDHIGHFLPTASTVARPHPAPAVAPTRQDAAPPPAVALPPAPALPAEPPPPPASPPAVSPPPAARVQAERGSPSPAAPPARTPPAQTAKVPKVTYRVTGAGGGVAITYRNASGANDRQTVTTLPWEVS